MLTNQELLNTLVLPFAIAAVVALIGAWRRWAWAMPLAAGAAFLVGYYVTDQPKWRPTDGADWLFWLAIPLVLVAALDGAFRLRLGWLLGALAGVVTFVLV